MVILFLILIFHGSLGNLFTFDDAIAKVQAVSSGQVITYSGETAPCNQLRIGDSQMYHISKAGVFQSSPKG
jgi:hypothetical protein